MPSPSKWRRYLPGRSGLTDVRATIYVEKDSQKGIIIGRRADAAGASAGSGEMEGSGRQVNLQRGQ